ncbi:S-adenosyl-L-methionine-dependent methyltransferase [Immersiella caudata]|uniref:S-adenosyl-L-methionine-dependent methyltransferase n=1 Tax=Immersiella caudata TaxID=314043 RepID=A0AA39T0I0_9PEZI|nr:S-adenosyl-L-methionine-dependent methyltransferase [Immersiella caudata]
MSDPAEDTGATSSEQQPVANVRAASHEDEEDADSAYGSPAQTSWSLTSSILKFREDHGRTYNPWSDYILPNDERESDRLDLQHHMFCLTYDGEICLCPAVGDRDKQFNCVLDIGTGTGIWAIDFADAHPESKVIGIDISPIQPSLTPPNLRFYVDDVERPWTFHEIFDFIHCRMMTGGIKDWPQLFERCFENLAPGGWIELADYVFPAKSDDDTLPDDSPLARWCQHGLECGKIMGSPLDSARLYATQLREAGFVNIVETKLKWPQTSWAEDQKHKELGIYACANFVDGLYGLSVESFTRYLGWKPDELQVFLAEVRKDIRNRKVHAYWPVWVVYAQRPRA